MDTGSVASQSSRRADGHTARLVGGVDGYARRCAVQIAPPSDRRKARKKDGTRNMPKDGGCPLLGGASTVIATMFL